MAPVGPAVDATLVFGGHVVWAASTVAADAPLGRTATATEARDLPAPGRGACSYSTDAFAYALV